MNVKQKISGFTLIEVMVALFIFAIVATLAVVGLKNILLSQEVTEKHIENLAQLQMAMIMITRDVDQTINRTIMDQNGLLLPSFSGNTQTIEFTHAGYINPAMVEDRSSLQRVAYTVENNNLIRITWPVLDRTTATTPTKHILLSNVNALEFHFIDSQKHVLDTWPEPQTNTTTSATTPPPIFPAGVEMVMTLKDLGQLQQFFILPKGNS